MNEYVEFNLNQNKENILNNEITTLTRMEQSASEDEEITENNYNKHNPLIEKLKAIIEEIKAGSDSDQFTDPKSLVDIHNKKDDEMLENGVVRKTFTNNATKVEGLLVNIETIHSTEPVDHQKDFSKTKRKGRSKVAVLNCDFCGKYSTSTTEHVNHLRVHQIRTKNFRQIQMLKKLKGEVPNGVICFKKQLSVDLSKFEYRTNSNDNKFRCTFCDKSFSSIYYLQSHIKIHFKAKKINIQLLKKIRDEVTDGKKQLFVDLSKSAFYTNNGKKFTCTFCIMLFNDMYHLKRHIKVHFKSKETYKCFICSKTFLRQSHCRAHVNRHKRKKYKCKTCHACFERKLCLEKHIVGHGIKFKCSKCNEKFNSSHKLNHHKRIHLGILFKCELCLKNFLTEKYLSNHMKRHYRKHEDRKFECHICSKKFYTKSHMATHIQAHTLNPTYKCHICSKVLTKKMYLDSHIQNHVGEKNHKCLEFDCNKTFVSHHSLEIHRRNVHCTKQLFKCNYCPRSYSEKTALRKHIKQHTEEEIYKCLRCGRHYMSAHNLKKHTDVCKPSECPVCSKKFNQQSQMKVHLLRHDGQRNWQCQICDKKFLLRCNLKQHLIIHTDMRPYKCKKCSKTFNLKSSMNGHMKLHENKKVPCTVCSKLFSSKDGLNKHMKLHTDDRKFKCMLCPKTFIQKTHLDYHFANHTGEKNFQCSDCPKAFVTIYKLKRHQKSHEYSMNKIKSKSKHWKMKFQCPDCPKMYSHAYKLKRHTAWGHESI